MALLGEIYLGGSENSPESRSFFNSSVGFKLKSPSKISEKKSFDNGNWEVEVQRGHRYIVARSKSVLLVDQILSIGFDHCQTFLDCVSISKKREMQIEGAGTEYILLFNNKNNFILREVSLTEIVIDTEVKITVTDKNGNIVPQPPQLEPVWTPAFRYYRLSQSSQDLFEAYRNLFLGFEFMLHQICPKNKGEREIDWLYRTLSTINKKIPLSNYAPKGVQDPMQYLIDEQYKGIRVKLFHAKGNDFILPFENLNPQKVADAYEALISLWREIASVYFNIPREGGVVTHCGFKHIMDKLYCQGVTFCATVDASPFNGKDTCISPLNLPVYPFTETKYLSESKPGNVQLYGAMDAETLNQITQIHRIGVYVDKKLISVDLITDGLTLTGIDSFERYETIRLINEGTPKIIF
ncbi:MAG: hypothetical protein PWR16_371 [Methanoculleus sp.]|nr:hypothetical protein [Methanoculleus sp.]